MTFYTIIEPSWHLPEPDRWHRARTLVYSEGDILEEYWDYWLTQCKIAWAHGSPNCPPHTWTSANCIEDWVVLHWAEKLGSTRENC